MNRYIKLVCTTVIFGLVGHASGHDSSCSDDKTFKNKYETHKTVGKTVFHKILDADKR